MCYFCLQSSTYIKYTLILCVYKTTALHILLLEIMLPGRIILFKYSLHQKNKAKLNPEGITAKENVLLYPLVEPETLCVISAKRQL